MAGSHNPHFLGMPEASGLIRVHTEDFRVEELPLIEPSGEGGHLWLEVEKRNANSNWVAEKIATEAGAALTSQWYSVSLQEASNGEWKNWKIPDVKILQASRHGRKLKRGALRGNRFSLIVRQIEGNIAGLEERLQRVAACGVPNYFGPQRFGRNGRNVELGRRWLEQGGRLPRNKKSIYLSSVRSDLFNRVLSSRVKMENWNCLIDGDIAMLDGRRSLFTCQMPDDELDKRCGEFDIHPTGPLPGRAGMQAERRAAAIEQAALQPFESLIAALGNARVDAGRRCLRLRPAGFSWRWEDSNLNLLFDLPPGGYATAVLRELVSTDRDTISNS
jgi:tRNA pseudouridine13 synthase